MSMLSLIYWVRASLCGRPGDAVDRVDMNIYDIEGGITRSSTAVTPRKV